MKKKIIIFSLLVLVISMTNTSFVNGKENQGIEQISTETPGSIGGLGYNYFKFSVFNMGFGISWSFSGVSDSIDVWVFDETNYWKFYNGDPALGYHVSDYLDNYVSNSGELQVPDFGWVYIVFYNPHILRVNYNDISGSIHSIYAHFYSVTYTPRDDDGDGYDDQIKVVASVSFDPKYYVEGYVKVYAHLYDAEGKIIDQRWEDATVINSKTFTLYLQNKREKGIYSAKSELFSFGHSNADDTDESSLTFQLYSTGLLTRILFVSLFIGGGIFLILTPTLIFVTVRLVKRRKRQATEIEEQQEIVEESIKVFCIHCGAQNVELTEFCVSCGEKIVYPEK